MERKDRRATYLVERYWPGVTIDHLLAALAPDSGDRQNVLPLNLKLLSFVEY
jgi:hypothetical protein